LENGLEGLLHISELADHKVENPEEIVKVGEIIEVKILRVDADERKIGLSRKRVEWAEEAESESAASSTSHASTVDESLLKGGVGGGSGPLIQPMRPAGKGSAHAKKAAPVPEEQSAESPETAGELAQAEQPENPDGDAAE
jgi:small subunit ribosomal protein S1